MFDLIRTTSSHVWTWHDVHEKSQERQAGEATIPVLSLKENTIINSFLQDIFDSRKENSSTTAPTTVTVVSSSGVTTASFIDTTPNSDGTGNEVSVTVSSTNIEVVIPAAAMLEVLTGSKSEMPESSDLLPLP